MHKNDESNPCHEREKEKHGPELIALFVVHWKHVFMNLLLKLVHVDSCEHFNYWVDFPINYALRLCR